MTETKPGLAERIEYILDPAASAKERLHRRSHLTNHDLRTLASALRSHERMREALLAYESHMQAMQADVTEYLHPDSETTNQGLIGKLIEKLDGPEQRRIAELAATALQETDNERR